MSITDPLVITYKPKRETWVILQGGETFYDEDNILREWKNEYEAVTWAAENLYKTPQKVVCKCGIQYEISKVAVFACKCGEAIFLEPHIEYKE